MSNITTKDGVRSSTKTGAKVNLLCLAMGGPCHPTNGMRG